MTEFESYSEWIRGANDAREGNEHKPDQSDDYDRGYASQYELDQIRSAQSEHNRAIKKTISK